MYFSPRAHPPTRSFTFHRHLINWKVNNTKREEECWMRKGDKLIGIPLFECIHSDFNYFSVAQKQVNIFYTIFRPGCVTVDINSMRHQCIYISKQNCKSGCEWFSLMRFQSAIWIISRLFHAAACIIRRPYLCMQDAHYLITCAGECVCEHLAL